MENFEFRATFRYILEKSDHDGYCSGEECYYSKEIITYPCPSLISSLNHHTVKSSGLLIDFDPNEWLCYLPYENINTNGSNYCRNSAFCKSKGLDRHDYRQTIIKIQIDVIKQSSNNPYNVNFKLYVCFYHKKNNLNINIIQYICLFL